MPKSFAEDGAVGAGTGGSAGPVNPPTPTVSNGFVGSDSGGSTGSGAIPDYAAGSAAHMAGRFPTSDAAASRARPGTFWQDYWGQNPDAAPVMADGRRLMFEDGGEVPDQTNELGDLLSLALTSVDQGLNYGRQKHGLMKQAAMTRMPGAPGNQSESGAPRPLPMPGPLPPTQNPFGQRRQFGMNDSDADEQGGIPDNDEDDTETA